MKITSPDFENNGRIPSKFTCDGENINPCLEIHNAPSEAKSLILIMDDPDVPEYVRKDKMYVHWVVYDMPPDTEIIPEDSVPQGKIGRGTSGEANYTGPCPPDREHRYFFKLYALDHFTGLAPGATKEKVEKAMEGHILAKAELIGKYERF